MAVLEGAARTAAYRAEFRRDPKGSDFLHWGEGAVSLSATGIAHKGRLGPGPDDQFSPVPAFVEDESQFLPVKDRTQRIADIKTFSGFLADVPPGVALTAFTAVLA